MVCGVDIVEDLVLDVIFRSSLAGHLSNDLLRAILNFITTNFLLLLIGPFRLEDVQIRQVELHKLNDRCTGDFLDHRALGPRSLEIVGCDLAEGVQTRAAEAGQLVRLVLDSEEDLVGVAEAREEAGRRTTTMEKAGGHAHILLGLLINPRLFGSLYLLAVDQYFFLNNVMLFLQLGEDVLILFVFVLLIQSG